MTILKICNGTLSSVGTHSGSEILWNHFSVLNCSRDSKFIELCVEVVEIEGLNLKRKIDLKKKKNT